MMGNLWDPRLSEVWCPDAAHSMPFSAYCTPHAPFRSWCYGVCAGSVHGSAYRTPHALFRSFCTGGHRGWNCCASRTFHSTFSSMQGRATPPQIPFTNSTSHRAPGVSRWPPPAPAPAEDSEPTIASRVARPG